MVGVVDDQHDGPRVIDRGSCGHVLEESRPRGEQVLAAEAASPGPDQDRKPGPKTPDYPADCLVDDCLIYLTGRVEKQTAPVQIALAQGITVRSCSLYDVPRAGINSGQYCPNLLAPP